MSFVSTASTLNIGDLSSNTVNITKATTLNLGDQTGTTTMNIKATTINLGSSTYPIVMKGINMPFSSINYASFIGGASSGTNANIKDCYCLLPYSTTQYLMVRWGYRPDPGDNNPTDVSFNTTSPSLIPGATPFGSIPYVFVTKYDGGGGYALVETISTSNFVCNSSKNDNNKSAINWLAIGVINISNILQPG